MKWPNFQLSGLAERFISGGTPNTKIEEYWYGDIPWITGADFNDGKVILGRRYISRAAVDNSATNIVPKGSILMVTRTGVGKIAIAPVDIAISQDITGVILKHAVSTSYIIAAIRNRMSVILAAQRGATIKGVTRKDVEKLQIPLPPPSEQRRIVEILHQADRLRKLRADADSKTGRILPALFIKMFGDPATNPMEWKDGTLGDVCERITDGTHQPPPFVENGIPFLFVQNIVKGFINFNTQKFITDETYKSLTRTIAPQKGDILYSTVGSCGVAVVVDTNRLFLFQRYIGHLRPKGALMDSWFLCAQMNTPYVKAQADQRARGIAQKTLNLSEIRQFHVIIPPLVEQKKFRLAIQNLEKIKGQVNDQEILIESLFKIFLHRAFTGDLTAAWRKAHMKELLQEMEIQAKALAS